MQTVRKSFFETTENETDKSRKIYVRKDGNKIQQFFFEIYSSSFYPRILFRYILYNNSDVSILFQNMLAGDCIDILSLIKLLYKGNNRSVLFDLHFGAQIFNIYDHDQTKLI